MNRLTSYLKSLDVSVPVYCLTMLFGMGSWLTINGVWVELPSIVLFLPEQWKLSSYLSLIGQFSNVGPIIVLVLNRLRPHWHQETVVTYAIISVGVTSSVMSAFLWQTTSTIGDEEHSIALFIFYFLMSLCDCTSTVIFLPFMALLKPDYMTGLYIGEGLSALVPALIALGQGVGETDCRNTSTLNSTNNVTTYHLEHVSIPPNFPVRDFFLTLSMMMLVCGISFSLLKYAPFCKKEHLTITEQVRNPEIPSPLQTKGGSKDKADTLHTVLVENNDHGLPRKTKFYWLFVICWVSFLANGFLPSINTYSSLPYGSGAFHLSAILDNIANPMACFVAFFLPAKSFRVLTSTTVLGTVFSVYLLILAGTSPYPPLVGTTGGSFLMVSRYPI